MAYALPTLKDIEGTAPATPSKSAPKARYAAPTLTDIGMKAPQPSQEVAFGDTNLQVGPWDTGIPLSAQADQFLSGMGRSFVQAGRSAKQIAGMLSKEEIARNAALDKPLMSKGWAQAGDIAGNIAMTAPLAVGTLPGVVGGGLKALGMRGAGNAIAKSLAAEAALTGAAQSQLRPTEEGESRAGNAVEGGLGGLAGYAVMRPVTALASKGINAIRNKWSDPFAQNIDRIAREHGVDLSIGDSTRSPGWRAFEDATKDIPFAGRKPVMERQAGQVQDMLHSLRENMRPELDVTDAAGAKIAEYATPEDMMVGELQRNFQKLTAEKDELFAEVGKVAAANPKVTKVDFSKTKPAVQQLLKSHPDIFASFKGTDQRLMQLLSGLDESLQKQGRNKTTGKFADKATYEEAQWLRQELGGVLGAAEKQAQTGTLNPNAVGKLKQVYKAVNADLDDWGTNAKNEPVHAAYKTAQDFYKDNVQPFKKDPTLRKVVSEFAPFDADLAKKEFFKEGRGNLAGRVMKFMTPEGQKAAQFSIIEDLTKRALNNDKETGLDITAFLNQAKRMDAPASQVYDPSVLKQMSDVEEVLRAAQRSENYMSGSPTTGRYMAAQAARTTAPYLMTGAAVAGASVAPVLTGVGMGGLLMGSNILNKMGANPIGKRMLMGSTKLGGLQPLIDMATTRIGSPALYHGLQEYEQGQGDESQAEWQ
jgi:hypothetical protein